MFGWRVARRAVFTCVVLSFVYGRLVSADTSSGLLAAVDVERDTDVHFMSTQQFLLVNLTRFEPSSALRLSFFGEKGNVLFLEHDLGLGGLVKFRPHREGRTVVTVFDPRTVLVHEFTLFGEMSLSLGGPSDDRWSLEYDMRDMASPLIVPGSSVGLQIFGAKEHDDGCTVVRATLHSQAVHQLLEVTSRAGTLRILGAPRVQEDVRITMEHASPFRLVETYLDEEDLLIAESVRGESFRLSSVGGRAVASGACMSFDDDTMPFTTSGAMMCGPGEDLTINAASIHVSFGISLDDGALTLTSSSYIAIAAVVCSTSGGITMTATSGMFTVSGQICSETGIVTLDAADAQLDISGSVTTTDASITISSTHGGTPAVRVTGDINCGAVLNVNTLEILIIPGSFATVGLELDGAVLSSEGNIYIDVTMGPGGESESAIVSSAFSTLEVTRTGGYLTMFVSIGRVSLEDSTLTSFGTLCLDCRDGAVLVTRGQISAESLALSGQSSLGAGLETTDTDITVVTTAVLMGEGNLTGVLINGMLTFSQSIGAPTITIDGVGDTTGVSFALATVTGFAEASLQITGESVVGDGSGVEGASGSISTFDSVLIEGFKGNYTVALSMFSVTSTHEITIQGTGGNSCVVFQEVLLDATNLLKIVGTVDAPPLIADITGLFGVRFNPAGLPSVLRAPTTMITGTVVPLSTQQSIGVQMKNWEIESNEVTITGTGGPGVSSVGTTISTTGMLRPFDVNQASHAFIGGVASSNSFFGSNNGCGVCGSGTLDVHPDFGSITFEGTGGSGDSGGIVLQNFDSLTGLVVTSTVWTLTGAGSTDCDTGPCRGVVLGVGTTIVHSSLDIIGDGGCGQVPQVGNKGVELISPKFTGNIVDIYATGGCGSGAVGLDASHPESIQLRFPGPSHLFGTGGNASGDSDSGNHGIVFRSPAIIASTAETSVIGNGGVANASYGIYFPTNIVFTPNVNIVLVGNAPGGTGSAGLYFENGMTVNTAVASVSLSGTASGAGENRIGIVIEGSVAQFYHQISLTGDSSASAGSCAGTCHGISITSPVDVRSFAQLTGTAETPGAGISLLEDVTVFSGGDVRMTGLGMGLPGIHAPFSALSGDGPVALDGTSDTGVDILFSSVTIQTGAGCAFSQDGSMSVNSFSFDNDCPLQMVGGTFIDGQGSNAISSTDRVSIDGPFELGNSHSSLFSMETTSTGMLSLSGEFRSGQAVRLQVASDNWQTTGPTSFFGFCAISSALNQQLTPFDLTLGGLSGSASSISLEGSAYNAAELLVMDDVSILLTEPLTNFEADAVLWTPVTTTLALNGALVRFEVGGPVEFTTALIGSGTVRLSSSTEIIVGERTYDFDGTIQIAAVTNVFLAIMVEGTLEVVRADSISFSSSTPAAVLDIRIDPPPLGVTNVHLNGGAFGCLDVYGGLVDLRNSIVHMDLGQTIAGSNSPCFTQDAFKMFAPTVEVQLTGATLVFEQDGPIVGEIFLFVSSGSAMYVGEFDNPEGSPLSEGTPLELPGGEVMTISYSSSFLGLGSGTDISLIPVPAPTAVADSGYTVVLFNTLNVPADEGLLLNDLFSFADDGNLVQVVTSSVTQPLLGTVVVAPNGAFTYVPTGGFAPTDHFTYRIEDSFGLVSNSAVVTLTLIALPSPSPTVSGTRSPSSSSTAEASPSQTMSPSVSSSRSRGANFGPSQLPSVGSIGSSPTPLPRTPQPSNSPSFSSAPSRSVQSICLVGSTNVLCVNDQLVLTVAGPDVVISAPDPDVIRQVDNDDVVSLILDVTPSDAYMPGDEAVLCFAITEDLRDDSCLGFINEDKNPPEWECEDSCIEEESGRACGSTRHFTNFAILLDGGKYGGSTCNSSDEDFVLDDWWQDLLLAFGLVVLVCCCLLVFALFLCTPVGSRLLYGKEGTRIRRTRSVGGKASHSSV